MTTAPDYDFDFYSDEFLSAPYEHYRAMRDLGPVVHLPLNNGYAITRFVDVRDALRNDTLFVSGRGVMMNQPTNELFAGSSAINMDGPQHSDRRQLIAKPLMPKLLEPLKQQIEDVARALVDRLVDTGSFDGVADFARVVPLSVVSKVVGLPEDGRSQMLWWANGIFNTMGNLNHRYQQGVSARDMALDYIASLEPNDLAPGSWGARAFELAAQGQISDRQAREIIMSYVSPALDTTINAASSALMLFGQNPEQWAALRADPTLLPAAMNEAMRLETPIRAFSRVTSDEAVVDGITIPRGARVLMVYASANRDERNWPDAARFIIDRKRPSEQLGFGTGVHMCAGMHLARLELHSLFSALVKRVVAFEVGEVEREPNQILRGPRAFTVRILETSPRRPN